MLMPGMDHSEGSGKTRNEGNGNEEMGNGNEEMEMEKWK